MVIPVFKSKRTRSLDRRHPGTTSVEALHSSTRSIQTQMLPVGSQGGAGLDDRGGPKLVQERTGHAARASSFSAEIVSGTPSRRRANAGPSARGETPVVG